MTIRNILPDRIVRKAERRHLTGLPQSSWDALEHAGQAPIRHHFMAEKIVDRFGLVLPRDRELIRQLAIVYVLEGMTTPPSDLRRAAA
jgi:hypothetical protein